MRPLKHYSWKKLALVRLQLQGKILGMLQEQSGWISGGAGESNRKHENSGKCDLRGKAGEEKPEQGLNNSPHVHKKKLWDSNQVSLCIPSAVGSLCSRKDFVMEKKHLRTGRTSLESEISSAKSVQKQFRQKLWVRPILGAWKGEGQTITPNLLYFSIS